ncbi:MAG TPA: MEDS domain-containing protein [Candidatus Bathyarchaeia archaeon]|nr:MEDS domain-containing protein [Candidatus Bathyarchaeia archaeon]
MIDFVLYTAFLCIIGALIIFFLRQKGSYFKPVQILLILAFASFATAVLSDFVQDQIIQQEWSVYYTAAIGLTGVIVTTMAVEHVSFVLYQRFHRAAADRKQITMKATSVLFKSFAITILVVSWLEAPWSTTSVPTLWGGAIYGPSYNGWFMYLLGSFLVFFILYPCATIMLSSLSNKEKTVSKALAWLGAGWAATGFSLIFFNAYVLSLGYEMIEIGYVFDMLFFAIIAYYFKKATILEKFFETPQPVLQVTGGEHLVVFYTSSIDKMKMFANYISEGLRKSERVVYTFPDEEKTAARLELKGLGMDVEKHEKAGSLVLMRLSEAYPSNGHFDKEKSIDFWKRFKEESKKKGFKSERDLFDLGDLTFLSGEEEVYLEYLREADTQIMDSYLTELRAINVEKLDKKIIEQFKFLNTKSMELLEHLDRFSKQLRLNHEGLIGRNILLEVSPESRYENAIQDFALEAAANIETITVFTTRDSAVYSTLRRRENARFFILTQLASTPQPNNTQDDIFLPARNTSLLLDALDKTLRVNAFSHRNIIFDNLSNLVLSVGFEKAYSFVQYALELLSSKKTTALFLFNPSAHDSQVASGLRSLFNDQIRYDENRLEIVKLYEPKNVKMDLGLMGEIQNERKK